MTVNAITDTKKGRTGIAPTYLHTTPVSLCKYCLVIGMFNGQFRFSENLMYEKKFAKVAFDESL